MIFILMFKSPSYEFVFFHWPFFTGNFAEAMKEIFILPWQFDSFQYEYFEENYAKLMLLIGIVGYMTRVFAILMLSPTIALFQGKN